MALLRRSSLDKVQEVIVMTNVDVDGRCYLRERVTDRLCKTNRSTSCYSMNRIILRFLDLNSIEN